MVKLDFSHMVSIDYQQILSPLLDIDLAFVTHITYVDGLAHSKITLQGFWLQNPEEKNIEFLIQKFFNEQGEGNGEASGHRQIYIESFIA